VGGIGLVALGTAGIGIFWFNQAPSPQVKEKTVDPTPTMLLEDRTQSSGLTFVHINGGRGDKLLPETMGGGGAFLDFDGDGRQDLFLTQSGSWPDGSQSLPSTCQLWKNLGQGRFARVEADGGAGLSGFYAMGAAVGDFDNDGWPDLAVTGLGGIRLLRNVSSPAGRAFQEITQSSGLPFRNLPRVDYAALREIRDPIPFATSVTWVDYDLDGLLDLAWGEYLTWSPASDREADARLAGTKIKAYAPPTAFPGARVHLWRNRGEGRFQDLGPDSGLIVREKTSGPTPGPLAGKTLGLLATDLDGDGFPELLASNDMTRNFLFHNQSGPSGGRRFVERGLETGFAYAEGPPRAGMGIDESVYSPGRRAVIVVNFSGEPNSFFELRSLERGIGFSERARAVGIAAPSRDLLKFGALFVDLDLDGNEDLVTTCGHLEPDIALNRKGQNHEQPPQFFWNAGDPEGRFSLWGPSRLGEAGLAPMVGRGCACADLEGQGRMSLVLFANGGKARLLRCPESENRWIRLVIRGNGTSTNRDAQGAVVEVDAAGKTQILKVRGGRSYLSQSELPLTIGLGKASRVDRVRVRFPNLKQTFGEWTGLETNQAWLLEEGRQEALPLHSEKR